MQTFFFHFCSYNKKKNALKKTNKFLARKKLSVESGTNFSCLLIDVFDAACVHIDFLLWIQ